MVPFGPRFVSGSLWLVGASLVPAVALSGVRSPGRDVSAELRKLYDEDARDQEASETMDEAEFGARQRARRDRVVEIVKADELRKPVDFHHAGWLLMHGYPGDDVLLSHVLAMVAGFEGERAARFTCAASLDRYLIDLGREQLFGSQTTDETVDWRDWVKPRIDEDGLNRVVVHVFADNGVAWREPEREAIEPRRLKAAKKELARLADAARKDAGTAPDELSDERRAARAERLERTLEIVAEGQLADDEAFLAAARVLYEGDGYEHFVLGHVLAVAAGLEGHGDGPALAAESLDRVLVALARPQVFGTQDVPNAEARPTFGALRKGIRSPFRLEKKGR